MKGSNLIKRLVAFLVPLLFAATIVTHHHDHGEDADHCDFCTTVSANRRRLMPSELLLENLVPGGRPAQEPQPIAYGQNRHHWQSPTTAAVGPSYTALAAPVAPKPNPESILKSPAWQIPELAGQDPTGPNSARAPPC